MIWAALSLAFFVAMIGVALSAISLPGLWVLALGSILVMLVSSDALGWWTVGSLLVIAAIGELVDFAASALGAKKMGGSRAGAIGSVVGTLVGAIGGSFIVPIIGSIIGGVLGAGLGAVIAERSVEQKTWRDSARSGQGAAVGRLISMFIKLMLAGAGAGLLVSVVLFNALS